MTSNIDSEIIKNLRASVNQNVVEQTTFSSMVLNGTEIKGANNTVSKSTKYTRQKPKEDKKKVKTNVKTVLTKIDQTVYDPLGVLPPLAVLTLYIPERDRFEDTIISASKMEFFIGGDREPELIYTLPLQKVVNGITYEVNIRTVDVRLNNTGASADDWIVSITWKYKIVPIPYKITSGFLDIFAPNDTSDSQLIHPSSIPFKGVSGSLPNGTRLKQQTFSTFDLLGDVSLSNIKIPSAATLRDLLREVNRNLYALTTTVYLADATEDGGFDLPSTSFDQGGSVFTLEIGRKDIVFTTVESTGRTFKASILGETVDSSVFDINSSPFCRRFFVAETNWTTYAATISPKTTPIVQEYSFEASFVDEAVDEPTDRDYASSHSLTLLGYGAIQSILEENYQNAVPDIIYPHGFRPGDRFFDVFPDNDLIKNQITEIFSKTPKLNECRAIPFINNKIVSYSRAMEVHLGETWTYTIGGDGFTALGTKDERTYDSTGIGFNFGRFPSRLGQAGNKIPLLSKYPEPSATTYIEEDRLTGIPKPRSGGTIYQTFGAFERGDEVGIAVQRFDREVQAFRNLADTALKDTRKNAEINIQLVPRIKEDALQTKVSLQAFSKRSGFHEGELNFIQEIRQSYVGSFFVAEALFSIFALYPDLGSGDPDYLYYLADNPLYLTTGMWNYRKRSIDFLNTQFYIFQNDIVKDFSYSATLPLESSLDSYYVGSGLPPSTMGVDNPTWLVKPNPAKPVTSLSFEGVEDLTVYSYQPICVNESDYSFFARTAINNTSTGYIEERCFIVFDSLGTETIIPNTNFDPATNYKTQVNAVNISRWLELFKKGNLVDNKFYLTQWIEILDIPRDYAHPITLFQHEAFCIYPFVVIAYNLGVPYRTVTPQQPVIALNNITFDIGSLDATDTDKWISTLNFCDPELVVNITYARIEDPTASPYGVGQDNPVFNPTDPKVLTVVRALSKTDPRYIDVAATENPGSGSNTWGAIYEFDKTTFVLSVIESNQLLAKESLVLSKATSDLTNIKALDDNFYRERARMFYK